jgi:hypothetical protein
MTEEASRFPSFTPFDVAQGRRRIRLDSRWSLSRTRYGEGMTNRETEIALDNSYTKAYSMLWNEARIG